VTLKKKKNMMPNIGREIETYLQREMLVLLRIAGELAAREGQEMYLVGGVVRDLIMGRFNLDIDLVVEGDALALARQLAKVTNGKIITHSRFGTANFRQGTVSLDLVTARSESYERPGALPTIVPGTIVDDLFRRDFSINAMAAHLDPVCFGELLDPYGGKSDIDRGLIRALHKRSFRDDPTRIWRALRYEQRLDFRLEADTENLLRRDLDMMNEVSVDRLRHEIELILKEDYPEKVLSRACELGVLQKINLSLEGHVWLAERFSQARQESPDSKPGTILYLSLRDFIERLKFRGAEARVLRDIPALKQVLPQIEEPGLLPSTIYRLLEHHQPQIILAAILTTESAMVKKRLELYLSDLRFVKPSLGGGDLKHMGVPVGRKLGWLMRALMEARLDGKVANMEDERELVLKWLGESKQRGD